MKRLCVFLGSSPSSAQTFTPFATELGHAIADHKIELIYGGANSGLMGTLSNAVLEKGGHVIGVIPRLLIDMEVAHRGISELHVVDSMHERKQKMFELADGFIALPGGFGTLEEIFEVLTWRQIGLHQKPCGFLNINGYYDKLFDFLGHAEDNGFLRIGVRSSIALHHSPVHLIALLKETHALSL
ncbi:MAG: TIGR00730 family Rossman fold protein [Deltaproteobacteria bacterium]|nr:TIGR00730 family Rossman fold protein [Deltaproteobacteria bacterium]